MESNYQKDQNSNNPKSKIDFSHVFDDVIEQRQQDQTQKPKRKKLSRKKLNVIYISIILISWIIAGFVFLSKKDIEEESFISPDDFIKSLREHGKI